MGKKAVVLVLVLGLVLAFGTGAAWAEKFVFGKHAAEMAVCDAQMVDLKAKTAVANQAANDAAAAQDFWLDLISYIPPVGVTMAWYNAGEMDYTAESIMAMRAGLPAPVGNASTRGVLNVLFKVPAGAPEGMFTYGVNRLFSKRWNELDAYNVFTEYGRPYLVDGVVIGTKVFFTLAGAGVIHAGGHVAHHAHHARLLPALGGHTGPVGQSFLWGAAGGGSTNLVAGAVNQFFQPSYKQYFNRLDWMNSRNPLPAKGL